MNARMPRQHGPWLPSGDGSTMAPFASNPATGGIRGELQGKGGAPSLVDEEGRGLVDGKGVRGPRK